MKGFPCNDILIEFDADSCRYYVIRQPPVAIGEGDSEKEALGGFTGSGALLYR